MRKHFPIIFFLPSVQAAQNHFQIQKSNTTSRRVSYLFFCFTEVQEPLKRFSDRPLLLNTYYLLKLTMRSAFDATFSSTAALWIWDLYEKIRFVEGLDFPILTLLRPCKDICTTRSEQYTLYQDEHINLLLCTSTKRISLHKVESTFMEHWRKIRYVSFPKCLDGVTTS